MIISTMFYYQLGILRNLTNDLNKINIFKKYKERG